MTITAAPWTTPRTSEVTWEARSRESTSLFSSEFRMDDGDKEEKNPLTEKARHVQTKHVDRGNKVKSCVWKSIVYYLRLDWCNGYKICWKTVISITNYRYYIRVMDPVPSVSFFWAWLAAFFSHTSLDSVQVFDAAETCLGSKDRIESVNSSTIKKAIFIDAIF